MEKSSKPKEKDAVPYLLWATEYAFVSPYSVDECITQLNVLKAKYQKNYIPFWSGMSFDFQGIVDNGGIVQFEIEVSASKQIIEIKSMGQLIYKDYHRTLVRIQTGITRKSALWDLIINVILCMIFALAYRSIGALFVAISVSAITHLITHTIFTIARSDIRASVYEALSAPKAPRPQTLPP
ncbi:MAG: hypothetical protein GC179_00645 [Anaerolineaceae bacterium]|nr:hypothetical protein [Anaerolineaceae bacterium]